jgi:hypothetical protein
LTLNVTDRIDTIASTQLITTIQNFLNNDVREFRCGNLRRGPIAEEESEPKRGDDRLDCAAES